MTSQIFKNNFQPDPRFTPLRQDFEIFTVKHSKNGIIGTFEQDVLKKNLHPNI